MFWGVLSPYRLHTQGGVTSADMLVYPQAVRLTLASSRTTVMTVHRITLLLSRYSLASARSCLR
jgi:hypothetical protein